MQDVGGVRSAAQRHQGPSEGDPIPALNKELLLLGRHLLPLPHILPNTQPQLPPLGREPALRQPPRKLLRGTGGRVGRPRRQPHRRRLRQHVHHGRLDAGVGGQDRPHPRNAGAAHHPGDVEEERAVGPRARLPVAPRIVDGDGEVGGFGEGRAEARAAEGFAGEGEEVAEEKSGEVECHETGGGGEGETEEIGGGHGLVGRRGRVATMGRQEGKIRMVWVFW